MTKSDLPEPKRPVFFKSTTDTGQARSCLILSYLLLSERLTGKGMNDCLSLRSYWRSSQFLSMRVESLKEWDEMNGRLFIDALNREFHRLRLPKNGFLDKNSYCELELKQNQTLKIPNTFLKIIL